MQRKRSRAFVVTCAVVLAACGGAPSAPSRTTSPSPPPPADAGTLNNALLACPTAGQIATINPIQIEFNAAARSGALACRASEGSVDLTAIQRSVYHAVLFLKNTRFDAPLPWTPDVWGWFVELNPRLYFFSGSSAGLTNCTNCQRGTAELNINLGPEQQTMETWPNLVTLAAVLVHEARHIEVGNHRCGVDDVKADDLEAFGVQYYYRVWVSQHTSPATFPSEYRPYMDWSNCQMRNSVFCNDHC